MHVTGYIYFPLYELDELSYGILELLIHVWKYLNRLGMLGILIYIYNLLRNDVSSTKTVLFVIYKFAPSQILLKTEIILYYLYINVCYSAQYIY